MASVPATTSSEKPQARPRELQDALNRHIYHPLAARLARLLRPTGISPNAVSVAGMLLVWGTAFAYVGLDWPFAFLVGFPLHLLWHVFDGADGDLARLTGRQSATGELVDGVCDYAGHVLLYVLLAASLDDWIGGWAWLLASLAGASHIAQTNHAETQRRSYLWWVYGVPWLKHAKARGDDVFKRRSWFSLAFGWMAQLYLRLPDAMTPWSPVIDAKVAAADADRRRRFSRFARTASRRALAYQKLVGPNPRTIILGISMAFGSPLYFFLAEVVLLNLVLAASVVEHNAVGRRLAAALN